VETRIAKFGSGVRQGCCLLPILLNLCSEYLTKEALEECGNFKIGQVIRTLKYADDLMMLAKAEAALQGMIEGN
jgi:hypothetical protein